MEKLNEQDAKKYLQNGELTKPFLSADFLKQQLAKIAKQRKEKNLDDDVMECLIDFIHQNLTFCEDRDFVNKNQFSRTAQEIFESKIATGCTDYAYVFASLARQLKIPTTILQTSQKEWTNKLINHIGDFKKHYGHTFCECFVNNKWVLVDPTKPIEPRIDWKYEQKDKIFLYFGKVGDSRTFLPYYRGLDLGAKMSLNEFLTTENKIIKEKFSNVYDTTLVKQRFEKLKTPEELKAFMDEILSYGWLDKDKKEHLETMKGIKNFCSMSVDEIFDYKIESCLESVKFSKYWFDKQNIKTKIYFSRGALKNDETNAISYPSMHFLLLFQCKNGKWGRFEQANIEEQGIYYFDNFEDAFKHVLLRQKDKDDFNRNKFKDEKNLTFSAGLFEFCELEDNLTFDELHKKTNKKENLYQKDKNAHFSKKSEALSQ